MYWVQELMGPHVAIHLPQIACNKSKYNRSHEFLFQSAFHFTSQIQKTMHKRWQMVSQQADNHHQTSSISESTFRSTSFSRKQCPDSGHANNRVTFKYLSAGVLKETEHTHMHTWVKTNWYWISRWLNNLSSSHTLMHRGTVLFHAGWGSERKQVLCTQINVCPGNKSHEKE